MALTLKKVNKIKISHVWVILVRAYGLKREREKIKREEEEGKRKKEKKEKFRYGNYFCKETIVRMLVWTLVRMLVWKYLFKLG